MYDDIDVCSTQNTTSVISNIFARTELGWSSLDQAVGSSGALRIDNSILK